MFALWLWIEPITELWVIWKHPQAATSHKEGQGKLRGKQHRSNRCEASAAGKDHHLLRREDSPTGSNLNH